MNRIEAEDFVYKSYLKAEKNQLYEDRDAQKRHPELSRSLLRDMSRTPAIVITGSKGKGSVANMIACILQSQLKVGLMTSPHIADFCERFRINGSIISDKDFVYHTEKIAPLFEQIDKEIPSHICISPMAIQAAIALSYFNAQQTQFNIFECGKGAQYDDVNNVKHDYAVINTIFLEHTRELGSTIAQIAEDKAHVITGEQKCVYIAEQDPPAMEVIQKRAQETHTPLKTYGKDFYSQNIRFTKKGMLFDIVVNNTTYQDILVPLLGEHQTKNCALALAVAIDILKDINIISIKHSLEKLQWPGRMEILCHDPFIILDACINRASCDNVKNVLRHLGISNCCTIIGIPDDKDFSGVAHAMAEVSTEIILTKSQNPHYKFTPTQKEQLASEGLDAQWTFSIQEALAIAKRTMQPTVILGTTSVVAEVKCIITSVGINYRHS